MICLEKFRQLQSNSCKFRLNSTKSKTVEQIHTNSDTQNRTWSKFIQWITSDFPFPLFPFSCIPLHCSGPWKPGGGPTPLLPEVVVGAYQRHIAMTPADANSGRLYFMNREQIRKRTEYRCSILPGSIPGYHLYFCREGDE